MKLISFIGMGKYTEVVYCFEDKKPQTTKYIQKAIYGIFKENIDSILLVYTNKSKGTNLSDVKNALKEVDVNVKIDELEISDGFSEDELKKNFTRICSRIEENEKIIFDITHSFRSIPLSAMVICFYLKVLRNVDIYKILYGAVEKLGNMPKIEEMEVEDRKAPIVDATYLFDIFNWTTSIDYFLKTGNSNGLFDIVNNKFGSGCRDNEVKRNTKSYIKEINELNKKITTCRMGGNDENNINGSIESIKQKSKYINEMDHEILNPLFEKVKEKYEFSNNSFENYIKILDYCLEYNYIQQGYTILNEIIPTIVLEKIGKKDSINDEDVRDAVSKYLMQKGADNYKSDKNTEIFNDTNKDIKKLIDENSDKFLKLGKILRNVKDFRNDINHAGYRKQNQHDYKKLSCKLKDFIDDLKAVIKDL